MPPQACKIIVIAGPPGTKRGTAVRRIVGGVEETGSSIEVVDLERCLKELVESLIASENDEGLYLKETLGSAFSISSITWKLPRDIVSTLWLRSCHEALSKLQDSDAEHKVLVAHFVYYRGETHEFYCPVALSSAVDSFCSQKENAGKPDIKVSRILVLIDDVYDMYVRLAEEGQVFCIKDQLRSQYSKMRHDDRTIPDDPQGRFLISLSLVIRTLLRLLAWREKEILAAETAASSFSADSFVLAVKHPISVGVSLTTRVDRELNVVQTYLSHPISRPRREERDSGEWPGFVGQFHEFIEALLRSSNSGCIPVMPTSIDEFRLIEYKIQSEGEEESEDDTKPKDKRLVPELGSRWPLLRTRPEELLYDLPTGYDSYETFEKEQIAKVFDPPISEENGEVFWGDRPVDWAEFTPNQLHEISGLMQALVMNMTLQMANRDHLLVRQCQGFLLFRPLFDKSSFSDGVRAEMDNWEALVQAEPSLMSETMMRPIFFLHADVDAEATELGSGDKRELQEVAKAAVQDLAGVDMSFGDLDNIDFSDLNWVKHLWPRLSELSGGSLSPEEKSRFRNATVPIFNAVEPERLKLRNNVLAGGKLGVGEGLCNVTVLEELEARASAASPHRRKYWDEQVQGILAKWASALSS